VVGRVACWSHPHSNAKCTRTNRCIRPQWRRMGESRVVSKVEMSFTCDSNSQRSSRYPYGYHQDDYGAQSYQIKDTGRYQPSHYPYSSASAYNQQYNAYTPYSYQPSDQSLHQGHALQQRSASEYYSPSNGHLMPSYNSGGYPQDTYAMKWPTPPPSLSRPYSYVDTQQQQQYGTGYGLQQGLYETRFDSFPDLNSRIRPLSPPPQQQQSAAFGDFNEYSINDNRRVDMDWTQYPARTQLSLRGVGGEGRRRPMTPPARSSRVSHDHRRRASAGYYGGSTEYPVTMAGQQGNWSMQQYPGTAQYQQGQYEQGQRLGRMQSGEIQAGHFSPNRVQTSQSYGGYPLTNFYNAQAQAHPFQGHQPAQYSNPYSNPAESYPYPSYPSAPDRIQGQEDHVHDQPVLRSGLERYTGGSTLSTVGIQTDFAMPASPGTGRYDMQQSGPGSSFFRNTDSRRLSQSGMSVSVLRRSLTSEDLRRISDTGNSVGMQAVPGSPRTKLIGGKYRNVDFLI
jgi:hypothetical protein